MSTVSSAFGTGFYHGDTTGVVYLRRLRNSSPRTAKTREDKRFFYTRVLQNCIVSPLFIIILSHNIIYTVCLYLKKKKKIVNHDDDVYRKLFNNIRINRRMPRVLTTKIKSYIISRGAKNMQSNDNDTKSVVYL